MERIMEFVNLETDLRENIKFNYLNKIHKESRHVWQDLLLEFGQDKYLETGFMIFMSDDWLKDFSKFTGVTVPKLKRILELFSEKNLIVSKLFFEKIIFSENFLRNHAGFFSKYEKKFTRRREKFEKNIKLFYEIRESDPKFTMTYLEVVQYFDDILSECAHQKNRHNNNNNNKNNNNNIINTDSNESNFQLTSPEIKKTEPSQEDINDFAEIMNEVMPETTPEKYPHESWQYGFAKHIEKILHDKDPNSAKQNLQLGAKYIDEINTNMRYTQSQIENVIAFFENEITKSPPPYPVNRIVTIRDFKQFFRKLNRMCENGIIDNYEERAAEIADKI